MLFSLPERLNSMPILHGIERGNSTKSSKDLVEIRERRFRAFVPQSGGNPVSPRR